MGMIIMNGKEYTSSPKDGFPPIIYSDEEREIGVWRDGKPLYQKSYSVNLPNSFDVSGGFLIDNDISYIDVLVDGFGSGVSPEGYIVSMGGLASVSGWRFNLHRNSSNQLVFFVSDADNHLKNGKAHVTIQYTKTTDVPGSGKYTTYGGLTHHYSTTEQVVGTWADGRPIYEKTWITNSPISIQANTWTNTEFTLSNLDFPVNAVLIADGGSFPVTCTVINGYVAINYPRGTSLTSYSIVIQYTKTTD